jgi:hypothetical protein
MLLGAKRSMGFLALLGVFIWASIARAGQTIE